MASKEMGLVRVLVTVTMLLLARTMAQSSDCSNVLIGLAPCLDYVSDSSSTPSPSCCSELASVVRTQPRCLCTLINGGGPSLGVTINETRALALPGACNVQTPPVSRCNVAGGPVMSPSGSPEGSPVAPPGADPTTDGPTGSRTGTANSETMKIPLELVLIFLFMASYA